MIQYNITIIFDRLERSREMYWPGLNVGVGRTTMSINKTLFFGALLVCTVFGVNEASKAQYDEEERQICDTPPHGFATVVDGERRIVPFEIVDGQAVVEGDIVIGQEDDLPGRAGYAPVISEFVNDQRTRWPKAVGVSEYIVPFTVDDKLIEEAGLPERLRMASPITSAMRSPNGKNTLPSALDRLGAPRTGGATTM
jgi:hypothetical protein